MACAKIKRVFRVSGEKTSVKGLGRAIKSRTIFLRFLWLVAVFVGASVAIYQLSLLFIRYFKYETITKVSEEPEAPTFPDITFCKLNPISKDMTSFLSLDDYLNMVDDFLDLTSIEEVRKVPGMQTITKDQYEQVEALLSSVSGYFENFPFNESESHMEYVDEFLVECIFYDWEWRELPLECIDAVSRVILHPQYLACPTLSVPKEWVNLIRGASITIYLDDFSGAMAHNYQPNLLLSTAKGVRMKIHERQTMPILKEGVSLPPGQEITVHLRERRSHLMEAPYGTCTKNKYLESEENDHNGEKREYIYKYESQACKELREQMNTIENCKCLSKSYEFSESHLKNGSKFCGTLQPQNEHIWDAVDELMFFQNITFDDFPEDLKEELYAAMVQTFKRVYCTINQTELHLNKSECPIPCKSKRYLASISQTQWPLLSYHLPFWDHLISASSFSENFLEYKKIDDQVQEEGYSKDTIEQLKNVQASIEDQFLLVQISFESEMTMISQQTAALTWEILFANLGGALNLWIGITFMTFIELVELIYNLITVGRQEDEVKSMTKVGPQKKNKEEEETKVEPIN